MSFSRAKYVALPAILAATAIVIASCGDNSKRNASGGETLLESADRESRGEAPAEQDPCTLLSANEAVPFVGTLVTPPYRAIDGSDVPDANGEECVYRGSDARQMTVLADWRGGEMMGKVLQDIPAAIGKATKGTKAGGMGAMTGKVLQQGPPGPWDKTTWIPGGSLFVYKGDAQIRIDMSGASGQQSDALVVAREIVPRIGHPLSYDGAGAVALAPKSKAHPENPCDFVPRSEVEAAIGALDGAPVPDSDGSGCTYRVATKTGERVYPVAFAWQGGLKSYNTMKHGMSTMSGMVGTPGSTALDTMKLPPEARQMLGGMITMIGGQSGAAGKPTARGAVTTVGLQTDTTLAGPWDSAMLLQGTRLMAVRGDVGVFMSLQSADYESAKALLRAVCSHL